MTIIKRPSPNHGARPSGAKPDLIVIHGTAGKTDEGDVAWCTDPRSEVSYHYIVGRDGKIYQLVPDEARAWHAGVSSWEGVPDCNDYSIGVAFSNDGREPYTRQQYAAGGVLLAELVRRHGIATHRIVGHYHVSPGRKTDPWYHFDWARLFAAMYAALSTDHA